MMHTQLNVWKKSIKLSKEVYQLTTLLPKDEQFGLGSQMKRSAISVVSNIAEGASRQSTKEYIRFLYISRGSIMELQAHYTLGIELGLLETNPDFTSLLDSTAKLLNAQINKLKKL